MSSDSRVELIYCEYEMHVAVGVYHKSVTLWKGFVPVLFRFVKWFGLLYLMQNFNKKNKLQTILCWELNQATSEFRRVQWVICWYAHFFFSLNPNFCWLQSMLFLPLSDCHHQFTDDSVFALYLPINVTLFFLLKNHEYACPEFHY